MWIFMCAAVRRTETLQRLHTESMERAGELCNRETLSFPGSTAMRRLFLSAILIAATTGASAAPLVLDHAKLSSLDGLAIGSKVVVDGFPDGSGGAAKLTFERVAVYAPGARLIVADASGEHEVPLGKRVELIGKDAAG